jgi:hypothetical protein
VCIHCGGNLATAKKISAEDMKFDICCPHRDEGCRFAKFNVKGHEIEGMVADHLKACEFYAKGVVVCPFDVIVGCGHEKIRVGEVNEFLCLKAEEHLKLLLLKYKELLRNNEQNDSNVVFDSIKECEKYFAKKGDVEEEKRPPSRKGSLKSKSISTKRPKDSHNEDAVSISPTLPSNLLSSPINSKNALRALPPIEKRNIVSINIKSEPQSPVERDVEKEKIMEISAYSNYIRSELREPNSPKSEMSPENVFNASCDSLADMISKDKPVEEEIASPKSHDGLFNPKFEKSMIIQKEECHDIAMKKEDETLVQTTKEDLFHRSFTFSNNEASAPTSPIDSSHHANVKEIIATISRKTSNSDISPGATVILNPEQNKAAKERRNAIVKKKSSFESNSPTRPLPSPPTDPSRIRSVTTTPRNEGNSSNAKHQNGSKLDRSFEKIKKAETHPEMTADQKEASQNKFNNSIQKLIAAHEAKLHEKNTSPKVSPNEKARTIVPEMKKTTINPKSP